MHTCYLQTTICLYICICSSLGNRIYYSWCMHDNPDAILQCGTQHRICSNIITENHYGKIYYHYLYFRSLGHTRQFCIDDFYCDPQDVPQPIHYGLQWEGITKKIQLPINDPVDLQNVVITNYWIMGSWLVCAFINIFCSARIHSLHFCVDNELPL